MKFSNVIKFRRRMSSQVNVLAQIIDFASGGKLILLDERDKFYDFAALTRHLIFW